MYTQTAYPVIDLAETGRSIERHRRQAGLTVRDLQTYFGFEYPQAIYKWQHGECLPSVDNLLALARLLQVPMEDLLVFDDQEVAHFLRTVVNYRFIVCFPINDINNLIRKCFRDCCFVFFDKLLCESYTTRFYPSICRIDHP